MPECPLVQIARELAASSEEPKTSSLIEVDCPCGVKGLSLSVRDEGFVLHPVDGRCKGGFGIITSPNGRRITHSPQPTI